MPPPLRPLGPEPAAVTTVRRRRKRHPIAKTFLILTPLALAGFGAFRWHEQQQAAAVEPVTIATLGTSGDLSIRVDQIVDPFPELAKPGFRFVAVQLSVHNEGEDVELFSAGAQLELRSASSGERFALGYAGLDLPGISGDLPPSLDRQGWAVFEVPVEATDLTLTVHAAELADGTTWTLQPQVAPVPAATSPEAPGPSAP